MQCIWSRIRTFARMIPALAVLAGSALAALAGSARADSGEVRLTVQQAVTRALRHNLSLKVDRLSPALSRAPEEVAEASFEPALFSQVDVSYSPGLVTFQRAGLAPTSATSVGGQVGVRKSFSSGTSADLSLSSTALLGGGVVDPSYQSGVTLSVRQSLLEGISPSANEIAITEARLSRSAAQKTLARQAEEVLTSTLEAYFDLHAALTMDAIEALAVQTTETTLSDTRVLIAAGKLPESEEISVRYALQTQQRAKLQTEHAVADARDRLARLIGLVRPGSLTTPAIVTLTTIPEVPDRSELENLRVVALEQRGDYQAARARVDLQRARVAASRHRVLPKLDLVGSVFLTGLSGDVSNGAMAIDLEQGYWSSYKMDQVGWSAGLLLEVPLGNRKARADLLSAEMELERARAEVDLVHQNIDEELNRAWRAVHLAAEQHKLAEAAEQVAQTKLKNEEALYRAGKTTAHILATVQAEAVKEKLARAQAVADLNKALVRLHATAGSLLDRLRVAI